MDFLKTLESKQILISSVGSSMTTYKLNRPVKIIIKKNVVDVIKSIYRTNYEKGGLLVARVSGTQLVIDNIRVIPNRALNATSYNPNLAEFRTEFQSIVQGGFLPFAFHTHPTELGIARYDEKRPNFFIQSSKPDQAIASKGYSFQDAELLMPECIFVVDSRYENGINLNFYEGGILPPSVGQLGTTEILTAVIGGGVLAYKILFSRNKYLFAVMALIALIFLYEAYRRPSINFVGSDIEVEFR